MRLHVRARPEGLGCRLTKRITFQGTPVSLVHLEATNDIPPMESQVVRSGHASTSYALRAVAGRLMVDEELTGRGDYPLFAILRCPGKGDFPYAELIVQSFYHRERCIPLPET